ncbi:hypothetical protein E9531_15585 [Lampropedia puyangensis]|uniref:Uncharacterized protein n=1 Tax=Lampropedia puyangensis TaxID=1330072 RepID=A0A4S8ESF4_9BURK|nr:hypothetical protein [Lampropedia puyangensis]THT97717.1 hypothetical protein E9531_15585 [Lampropedia puyangensis]
MNEAAERFTGNTKPERAYSGEMAIGLFLDPSNPTLNLEEVPGVAHLPIKGKAGLESKRCRLIHAKVALLGFRDEKQPNVWCLRLVVATGNWTRQTLEESLDLAWSIDVTSGDLTNAEEKTKQACADLFAAAQLFEWLRSGADGLFNTDLLHHSAEKQKAVDSWLSLCQKAARGYKPRFLDNRSQSLLSQLPKHVARLSDVTRNYLAMGSGFFEGGTHCSVPQEILTALRNKNLLTQSAEVDIFVNASGCQSIAGSKELLKDANVKIRPPKTSQAVFGKKKEKQNDRGLHAKFLFSANYQKNSNACNKGWVYLGSGNLTRHGFTQQMDAHRGNLEAGVIFELHDAYWYKEPSINAQQVITNLLPIQWDEECKPEELAAGDAWEPTDPQHFAPPVPWLVWYQTDERVELRLPDSVNDVANFTILDDAGAHMPMMNNAFHWRGEWRQQVLCEWTDSGIVHTAYIPILDTDGRLAATPYSVIHDLNDLLRELSAFPNPPDIEDEDEDEETVPPEKKPPRDAKGSGLTGVGTSNRYAVRQMMELLERIASQQTQVAEHDWRTWCTRLEQTLVRANKVDAVIYFVEHLKLNPLAPLRDPAFRPDFAVQVDSDAYRQYKDALDKIEQQWVGGADLKPLGGEQ